MSSLGNKYQIETLLPKSGQLDSLHKCVNACEHTYTVRTHMIHLTSSLLMIVFIAGRSEIGLEADGVERGRLICRLLWGGWAGAGEGGLKYSEGSVRFLFLKI